MKATKKAPENAELHCNLSYALLKEHKFHKALAAAEKACELDDSLEKAHHRRALALVALERWEDGVKALMVTQEKNPVYENKEVKEQIALASWRCKKMHLDADTPVPELVKDAKQPEEEKKPKVEEGEEEPELSRQEKLKKLAAVQAANIQSRTRKYNKKLMHKKVANHQAETELVTKDMIAKAKATLNVDKEAQQKIQGKLSTDDQLKEKQESMKEGDKVEYDGARVARFAEAELQSLLAAGERQAYQSPVAVMLPGVCKEGWGDEGQGVSMNCAFDSEVQHGHSCRFVKQYADQCGAHAMLIITPKANVKYPTLWEGKKKQAWNFPGEGFMVQLEALDVSHRDMWFVETGADLQGPGTLHKLEKEEWSLVPAIFQGGLLHGGNRADKRAMKKNKKAQLKKAPLAARAN